MKLLIIRHGQSEADLLDVHEGRADFPLTALGHRQAKAMAAYVKARYRVERIYCSPLLRARQTADHLAAAFDLQPEAEPRLMEFNNGLLAGLSRKEAAEKYPEVPELPLHEAVYQQESKLEFRFRAEYALSKILSENRELDTVAVVTHGGMVNQLYRSFLRLSVDSDVLVRTGDTGIHVWAVEHGTRRILCANDTAHLLSLREDTYES